MLVLSRKVGETILIGDHIEVTVVRVCQNAVRIGIQAPSDYRIAREEIRDPAGAGLADPGAEPGTTSHLPLDGSGAPTRGSCGP